MPELVPRAEVPAAITLNGVSMNASRAVGPALGGVLVAAAGPEAAFLLNALSFIAVLWVLFRWDRPAAGGALPPLCRVDRYSEVNKNRPARTIFALMNSP